MVIDLERWRASKLDEVLLRHLAENIGHVPFGDQDVLNAVLHDRWRALDPRWTWLCLEPIPEGDEAFVYHYCWKEKPWIEGSTCREKHLYDRFLELTPRRRG